MPLPFRLTVEELPVEELLVNDSCPVKEAAVVGSNLTASASVWPAFNVTGKVAPE